MSREGAEVFRGKQPFVSAWGQTNRLLTGPFQSEAAANSFIAQLRHADVDGAFVWTSPAGQVVDALGGEPGIHSARWAGPDGDFRAAMNRIQTLLIEQGARTPDRRRAHFVAALCLAWPDGHVETFEGRVDGVVIWPPRGDRGFGYDPLFRPDGFDITFGQMSAENKHGLPPKGQGLSHRARAFMKLAEACLRR